MTTHIASDKVRLLKDEIMTASCVNPLDNVLYFVSPVLN